MKLGGGRLGVTPLLGFTLLLGLGGALAQTSEVPLNIGRYLAADAWLGNLQQTTALYTTGIGTWAGALVALGCVLSLVFTMLRGSVTGYLDFFSRLLIVAFIFGSITGLTQFNFWMWNKLREWSMQEVSATFVAGAPELQRLGADSAILLTALGAPSMLSAAGEASAMVASKAGAAEMGGQISRFLNLAIVPILTFVVMAYLMILLSGLMIAFANVILPISAAMLMFGADIGAKWLGAFFASVMTSLFVVAFMPIAFNATFSFTVVQPVRTLNDNFASAGDIWEKYKTGTVPQEIVDLQNRIAELQAQRAEAVKNNPFDQFMARNLPGLDNIVQQINRSADELKAKTETFFKDQWNQVWTLASATLTGTRNMLLRMALFLLGTLVGLYFIGSSWRGIAGLIGGVGMAIATSLSAPLDGLWPSGGGGEDRGFALDTPKAPAEPATSSGGFHGGPLATMPGAMLSATEGSSSGGGYAAPALNEAEWTDAEWREVKSSGALDSGQAALPDGARELSGGSKALPSGDERRA